jgi:serine protease
MLRGAAGARVRFGRRVGVVAGIVTMTTGLLAAAPDRVAAQPRSVGPDAAAATSKPANSAAARSLQGRLAEIDLDHVLVRLRSLPADINARFAREGAAITRSVADTGWTELSTPRGSARRVRARLQRDPSVAQASFSYISHALTLPDDPQWSAKQSSYLSPLRLDRAWDYGKGAGVTVAVIDTGTDLDHPDLAGQRVTGTNVLHPGAQPQDDNGHGTLVSGIVAAKTNNGRGVVGIAPSAKVMPIKVLDSTGSGSDTNIAIGINYARDHGAKVINLSLGGTFDDPALRTAVASAISHGIVVVAAAGNDGTGTVGFPASYPGVLAVGATDHTGALTSFSSYGPRVDVVAPGLDITSTALGSTEAYSADSGTSFSSPIVAGVAAMLRGKHPTWTQAQVTAQIRNTARDLGLPGVDPAFGHGMVDPLAALGGPAAAPHPSGRVGADEPNDTPSTATSIAVGVSHSAGIAPETDEDWYAVPFSAPGWYTVHLTSAPSSLAHAMESSVSLYHPDHSFAASQELAGGDLAFKITVTGSYFLRVRNGNGSTASYTITVSSIAQPTRFAPSLDIDFGTPAQSVAIADVDGDGRKDVLIAFGDNSGFPDTLAVFSQTSTRSLSLFAALPTDIMTGGGLATGDLNGDGKADVVIPVSGGFDIFTHLSQSTIPSFVPRSGTTTSVAIADVDGDGSGDIVAAGSLGVQAFWGPAFNAPKTVTSSTTTATMAVGDVAHNGDGLLDIVTCCARVFKQTGSHVFALTNSIVANASDVAVGDVNSDGVDDVVVTQSTSGSVSRLVNDGSGTLAAPVAMTGTAAGPQPVSIAHVDGTGTRDVVVLHHFVSGGKPTASLGSFRQTNTGGAFAAEQFAAVDDFTTNYDAKALAVGDLDGDGANDALVATEFGMSILVQNSGILPALGAAWVIDTQPASLATNVSANVAPTITLGRDVTNADGTTVKLDNAAGASVPATISYNAGLRRITVTPASALANGAYAVHLTGLHDTGGEVIPDAGTTFRVGAAPDEVAPQTTVHTAPSGTVSTATATVSFGANEAGSSFYCSTNNSPYVVCTSPHHVTGKAGGNSFRVFARDPAGNEDPSPSLVTWTYAAPVHGYWMLGGAGTIYNFGTAPGLGSASTLGAVDMEATATGHGYWIVNSSGRVFAFGTAQNFGNAPALAAGDSVTSISRTSTGNGYWLFTTRGLVYPFGDAHMYGDLRATHLNGGVIDSVRTASGHGYYMVATDGGVFSFGDARFYGSTGALRLNARVRSLVPDPDGVGYWLVAVDGGVFAFDAPYRGSMGGSKLNRPIVGMVSFGNGYLMVAADGGIFDFSTKPFLGSLGGHPPAVPIVSVAAVG